MSGHQPEPYAQETGMIGQPGAEKLLRRKPGHKFKHPPVGWSRLLFHILATLAVRLYGPSCQQPVNCFGADGNI